MTAENSGRKPHAITIILKDHEAYHQLKHEKHRLGLTWKTIIQLGIEAARLLREQCPEQTPHPAALRYCCKTIREKGGDTV